MFVVLDDSFPPKPVAAYPKLGLAQRYVANYMNGGFLIVETDQPDFTTKRLEQLKMFAKKEYLTKLNSNEYLIDDLFAEIYELFGISPTEEVEQTTKD